MLGNKVNYEGELEFLRNRGKLTYFEAYSRPGMMGE